MPMSQLHFFTTMALTKMIALVVRYDCFENFEEIVVLFDAYSVMS
jgi:predicted RNA-binding protein with PIN domain